ncbi:MAG: type II toxin-antitoxin system RelE/ParE family toxin [Erysipelotrichaceae bacterium]|nr:type II toxin-antitoxin system RelE/ParE family toxin [Erysipelotrichaceae bacterium]
MIIIEIEYRNKKVEDLCTNYKKARKELNSIVAEKLHALINLIESADTLQDIAQMKQYHLHPLLGNREGQYALDIAGRTSSYRLIIIPLDENGHEWKEKNLSSIYKMTKVIIAWEVTKHYE